MVQTPEVRPDCRHYIGYKPCGFQDTCLDCPSYEASGKRILIIKLGAAGDVIRTTPILSPLRQRESPCHITWLTDPVSMDLLKETRNIDRLMPYSWENCMVLQGRQFDLLINLDKEPRALALAELVPAQRKMGFAPGPTGGAYVYNEESLYALRLGLSDPLKFHQNTKSATAIVFECIGLPYEGQEYEIGLSARARQFGQQLLTRNILSDGRPVVGINTGCGEVFQTKRWTLAGLSELIDQLLAGGDCHVMLLGGPREVELNAQLMVMFHGRITDSGCENTVEEFMGVINACDLVVTADTMALHIAIALRKEVVALFGPTCHQEIDLFGRGEKIVTDFVCSPCYRRTCDKDPTCMKAMESSTVAQAVNRRLNSLRPLHPLKP